MAVTIQLRRGPTSGLGSQTFAAGEMAFTTDAGGHDVYVSDGSANYKLSMDKDWTANSFKYAATAGTPVNKSAAEVMGLLSGQATADFNFNGQRVTDVSDPTAATDAATKSYVDHLVGAGIVWRAPVLKIDLTEPEGGESTGDRYYINGTGSGAWANHERCIAEKISGGWEFWPSANNTPIEEGDAFYNDNDNKFYFCNDTSGNIVKFANGMGAHAASHVDGTDDIQLANSSQKGLMSGTYAEKLDNIEENADVTDSTNVDAAGAVMNSDYGAHSVLRTEGSAGSPGSITIGTESIVGRASGSITALSGADIWAILSTKAGSNIDMNSHTFTNLVDPTNDQDAATQGWVNTQIAGKDTFLELNDVDPNSYTGEGGKVVVVNSAADGVEFDTISGGTWT